MNNPADLLPKVLWGVLTDDGVPPASEGHSGGRKGGGPQHPGQCTAIKEGKCTELLESWVIL